MRKAIGIALLVAATPAVAAILPQPDAANPRLQIIREVPADEVQLTALPGTGLTVMLEPGERIVRATIGDPGAFDVRISAEADSFLVLPLREGAESTLEVVTDRRDYRFALTTGSGLMAAYLVRFELGPESSPRPEPLLDEPTGESWSYRLRGDRAVSPAAVVDDGVRTWVTFGSDQAMPAVFALGPTGEEQVVNGYIRDGLYVIDRVHQELVFRIDRSKATATRHSEPEKAE